LNRRPHAGPLASRERSALLWKDRRQCLRRAVSEDVLGSRWRARTDSQVGKCSWRRSSLNARREPTPGRRSTGR
jgi:hypothetical protein